MSLILCQSTLIQFLWVIRKSHRLAYEKHKKSVISIFVSIEVCQLWMMWYQGNGMVNSLCNLLAQSFEKFDDSEEVMYGGICVGRDPKTWDIEGYKLQIVVSNLIYMTPVLVYFIMNEPHDCYVCLGKDPDRIYSSFQLTLEERAKRQLRAKTNKK